VTQLTHTGQCTSRTDVRTSHWLGRSPQVAADPLVAGTPSSVTGVQRNPTILRQRHHMIEPYSRDLLSNNTIGRAAGKAAFSYHYILDYCIATELKVLSKILRTRKTVNSSIGPRRRFKEVHERIYEALNEIRNDKKSFAQLVCRPNDCRPTPSG